MWWENVDWIHLSMANDQWLYKHRLCEYVDWTYLVLLNMCLFCCYMPYIKYITMTKCMDYYNVCCLCCTSAICSRHYCCIFKN